MRYPVVAAVVRALSVCAVLTLAVPRAALAHDQGYGFVLADNPSASSYTPSATHSYNDSGTPPRITRSGTGLYTVVFPGLSGLNATSGNVQVNAVGTSSNYCKAAGWSGDSVSVACFTNGGSPADTQFSLLFLFPDYHADSRFGFAVADQSASASYTPDAARSYNGGGGAITATRSGTGLYTMTWTGMSAIGTNSGHVQVTAYGPGNARCHTGGWGAEFVNVRCFDATGAAVDSQYSILYWRSSTADRGLAYAWAHDVSTASYTAHGSYSYNAAAGAITATRSATGVYAMTWTSMSAIGINAGNVQVTAYSGNGHCKVASWAAESAEVRCFDAAGAPADAQYDVMLVKPPRKPWAQDYAFALADQPATASYTPPASHNQLGGPVTITRLGTGSYQVQFTSFATYTHGGNVQVTAFGSWNGVLGLYCKVSAATLDTVSVNCFNVTGVATDSYFTVLFLKNASLPTALAYAWANDPGSASYTPVATHSYNPAGGAITATRTGVGVYTMTWSGFGALGAQVGLGFGGHPNVTAHGSGSARCAITGWSGDSVGVRCFTASGASADSAYMVMFARPDLKDDGLAYAWASSPTSSSYTPHPTYYFNSGSGPGPAQRFGVGTYRMNFPAYFLRGFGEGHVQVNSYPTSPTEVRCQVAGWDLNYVDVRCHNPVNGNPVDALYNVMFIKPVSMPEPGRAVALALGAALLALLRARGSRSAASRGRMLPSRRASRAP